ncbi:MAG: ATP-binding cassette domain-containing protein [Puniceicoccales bacterium]|jgi:peptide/nickel transport system ATP-binding protein/oligopeptide transport system ATP-binding protein|nr:ATP-binding cassette domain-containing protein [Puniceicoccales bacterium]
MPAAETATAANAPATFPAPSAANVAPAAPAVVAPLLRVENLVVRFPARGGLFGGSREMVAAVDDVSFEIGRGQIVALAGESGSGKTTTGRAILKLAPVAAGKIIFDGVDIAPLTPREFFPWRKRIQMVFQDPWHSLNPRLTLESILAEPLEIHFPQLRAAARRERVAELLRRVKLPLDMMRRHPHELSGGQRQRVGIARAVAVEPELLVCDEPVSALDVSVQAQIIALLRELRAECGFACLFVSHDLAVVEQLADGVLIMREGKIVERGEPAALYANPQHPYTRALLDAVPVF